MFGLDIAALAALYFFVFYRKWKNRGKDVLLINTVMYLYLSMVLAVTMMPVISSLPFIFNHAYVPMNLVPFTDVALSRGDFIRQVVLNVIMTIPFGFLLPLTQKEPKILKTILLTFLLSFAIEILQPLINDFRRGDVTDLITNVTGGIIGYMIYLIFRPLTSKILNLVRS